VSPPEPALAGDLGETAGAQAAEPPSTCEWGQLGIQRKKERSGTGTGTFTFTFTFVHPPKNDPRGRQVHEGQGGPGRVGQVFVRSDD
jgi:hypothetical protein